MKAVNYIEDHVILSLIMKLTQPLIFSLKLKGGDTIKKIHSFFGEESYALQALKEKY